MELHEQVSQILGFGPRRVVVRADGYAVTALKALRDYHVDPDVIFVRNDGWSLGASGELEHVARRMWEKQWVARIDVKARTYQRLNFPAA